MTCRSQTKKTNSSVKTGLKIEAGAAKKKSKTSAVRIRPEKDEDELVHQAGIKRPEKKSQQDMDDLVHQKKRIVQIKKGEEQDIDDLIHPADDYKRDQ